MSEKRAGGILVSSFVAGALLAAAIFAPSAWEPVPGPYFGLEDQATRQVPSATVPDAGMEAAHAELSARALLGQPPAANAARPQPDAIVATDERAAEAVAVGAPAPIQAAREASEPAAPPPVRPPSISTAAPADTLAAGPASEEAPAAAVVVPPERVAVLDASTAAATAALARTLPAAVREPASSGGLSAADAVSPRMGSAAPPERLDEPPESLRAMASRRQAARSSAPPAPAPVAASTAVTAPLPRPEPIPVQPPPPVAVSSAAPVVVPRPADILPPPPGPPPAQAVALPRPLAAGTTAGSLGAAPLPGEPWTDPDSANWSEIPGAQQAADQSRRRGWLAERAVEGRAADDHGEQRAARGPLGGRILDRLRNGGTRVARNPDVTAGGDAGAVAPPDIGRWPRPIRLEQQFDHLAELASAADRAAVSLTPWIDQSRAALGAVMETRGPRDAAADSSLVALGEQVLSGMSLADSTADQGVASHTRRAALAIARRVAVWRATAALCVEIHRGNDGGGDAAGDGQDAAAAMTRQAAGRAIAEIARLLDALERFEIEPTTPDALVVKTSLGSIGSFYPAAAHAVLRAVEDHYVAPNVRVAVHQHFMEKLMPAASVDTAPFQDVVMGREVRGTRRVERTTTLRLVPDDDEISFNLEVHGDIASRSTTESGPVSVTARSASAFTVRKPIKISTRGLVFGAAAGSASNRSHVDAIQTSFDAMPVMGSLVRNIARNQQAEAMPEANREVIDKIVSRACREVDTQSEPQFVELAQRVRDRAWMPLVNLGLEPKAVALETSSTLATMRLRLAAASQLAAHTPRPRAPADAMLSVQVHESSANNVVDRLGLAGRRYTLEELIRMVCAKIGAEPRIPDELPEGVAVAFAEVQPLRVECRDGLVHVWVKLDAIESGRRDWVDIVAHVSYRPVCSGLQVFLERDGPIRLSGPGHEGRMELALRTIFGKVFPKERPIALMPEKMVADPRLAGMQAVQAVSSDGWLAIAIEQVTVAQPAGPAVEKRAADVRRKVIFR